MAGLLLAGADGIAAEIDPGPADDESAGGYEAHVAETRYRPLPRSLVDGRRAESEAYRRHVTTWERDRYLTQS